MGIDQIWAVYALHDPSGAVRYVGISKNPTERVIRHFRECRYGSTKRKTWLRSVLLRGEEPQYSILEWTDDWDEAEKRWIAYFKASGANLVNGNEGGRTHQGTRVPNPHPTIRRLYRKFESNARSKYATARSLELLDKYKEIVKLQKKAGTLDWFEERLSVVYAARNN